MEERIETNERQLKAAAEIEEEFTGDTLQRDFKALEKGAVSVSIDNQLLALKQKMGMLPAGGAGSNRALGAGSRNEEAVSAEVERPGDEKKR
jgi:phage shock protein A